MKTATPCIDGEQREYLEVWEKAHGPVPYERRGFRRMSIHHVCRNGKCLNVNHMVMVTAREHALLHRRMKPAA